MKTNGWQCFGQCCVAIVLLSLLGGGLGCGQGGGSSRSGVTESAQGTAPEDEAVSVTSQMVSELFGLEEASELSVASDFLSGQADGITGAYTDGWWCEEGETDVQGTSDRHTHFQVDLCMQYRDGGGNVQGYLPYNDTAHILSYGEVCAALVSRGSVVRTRCVTYGEGEEEPYRVWYTRTSGERGGWWRGMRGHMLIMNQVAGQTHQIDMDIRQFALQVSGVGGRVRSFPIGEVDWTFLNTLSGAQFPGHFTYTGTAMVDVRVGGAEHRYDLASGRVL